ncbi:hypothetical protein Emed_006771 [Eimeria media]
MLRSLGDLDEVDTAWVEVCVNKVGRRLRGEEHRPEAMGQLFEAAPSFATTTQDSCDEWSGSDEATPPPENLWEAKRLPGPG